MHRQKWWTGCIAVGAVALAAAGPLGAGKKKNKNRPHNAHPVVLFPHGTGGDLVTGANAGTFNHASVSSALHVGNTSYDNPQFAAQVSQAFNISNSINNSELYVLFTQADTVDDFVVPYKVLLKKAMVKELGKDKAERLMNDRWKLVEPLLREWIEKKKLLGADEAFEGMGRALTRKLPSGIL